MLFNKDTLPIGVLDPGGSENFLWCRKLRVVLHSGSLERYKPQKATIWCSVSTKLLVNWAEESWTDLQWGVTYEHFCELSPCYYNWVVIKQGRDVIVFVILLCHLGSWSKCAPISKRKKSCNEYKKWMEVNCLVNKRRWTKLWAVHKLVDDMCSGHDMQ